MAADPSVAYLVDMDSALAYSPMFPQDRVELKPERIEELKAEPGDYFELAISELRKLYSEKYLN